METENRKDTELIPDEEQAPDNMQISEEIQGPEEGQMPESPAPAPKKKRKKLKTAVIVILSVLLVLVSAGIFLINYFLNKIRRVDPSTGSQLSPSEIAEMESSYWASVNSKENEITTTAPPATTRATETGTDEGTETEPTETEEPTEETQERVVRSPYQADAYRATLSADDEQVIFDHPVSYTWLSAPDLKDENLINIMLVGQDTRNADMRERSDTMILVSINPKTHKVSMISFMRDLYVPLGDGYGMGRLNTAYKIGGFPFMYKVFETNYGVHIDGGICVNFGQFMTFVDTLGGVDVTLNETEAKWLRYTLEQSVPDMRYWGKIVEAQMPSIKEGTSVKDAISALKAANLSYAYSDMNGGAAPDDISKAKVKSFWADASCTTAAKAGRYYNLQQTIYITYTEDRAAFPKLADDISVSSAVSQLKSLGFKTAYADVNGGVAPEDSKAALITGVTLDAAGKTKPVVGKKYDKNTKVYIAYMENKADIPKMSKDITVKEAEELLKAAGLKISWAESSGGVAPSDKSKATLTGIYLDKKGTQQVKAGDKLDINTRVYLAYKDDRITMPTIKSGTSVKDAETALKNAGFKVAYANANKGKAPSDKSAATVSRITTDAAGTKTAKAGTKFDKNTTLYLTYSAPQPTTEEPTTEAPTTEAPTTEAPHEHNYNIIPDNWQYDETSHYRTLKCSCGATKEEREAHNFKNEVTPPTTTSGGYTTHTCTVCGYSYTDSYTDPVPTTEEPTTEAPTTEEPTTEEPTTEAPTTEEPTTEAPIVPTTEEPTLPSSEESSEPGEPSSETNAARSNEGMTEEPEEPVGEAFAEEAAAAVNAAVEGSKTGKAVMMVYNPILTSSKSGSGSYEPDYLANIKAGTVHLNGMQTLAYCRMRKLDSDFKRTERQRMILNTLFSKVKSSDVNTLINLLNTLLPQVVTDMSNAEIMSIATQVLPYFGSTQISSYSVPANGTWRNATINGAAVIQSDQEANIEAIRSWLPY